MFHIKKQISKLYASSMLGNMSLTGAWVAILAARGYSLVEIGIAETVFHITSLIFEIPSGVFADVFGRKKMLIVSTIMRMIGSAVMILSNHIFMVCMALSFFALSYNFSSGSDKALAYDSLKLAGAENRFEKYRSNQLIIYRLCSGISTLCAGFALMVGHRISYGTSLVTGAVQIAILLSLHEVYAGKGCEGNRSRVEENKTGRKLLLCLQESLTFLKDARKAMGLMFCNSFVGAVDILLLFFLQAKLPEKGMSEWWLGLALLFMEMGGIVGSGLIVKFPKIRYRWIFVVSTVLVLAGVLAEHSPIYWVMVLGGFIAVVGDDALQVRTDALLQNMFPSKQRATLTSFESFCFSVVMIVLSPLAGLFFTCW